MQPADTLEAQREAPPLADASGAVAAPARRRPEISITEFRYGIRHHVAEAWRQRALLPRLGAKFLGKRIQGTKLGRAWLVIRPLMQSLGMTLLFGGILGVSPSNKVPYYLFLMSGLVGWRFFDRGVLYSARSFSLYRKQMTSFHFPLLLVPLAGLAYPLVDVAIYWLVFFGALLFFWALDGVLYLQWNSLQLLLVIPGVTLATACTVGLSLWTSVLNAKARDTRYTLRFVLPIWMYLTPIVYPLSQLPDWLEWLGVVNPMSAPIEMIKSGLINAGYFDFTMVAASSVTTTILLLSGLWFFAREGPRSIDAYEGPDDEDDEDAL